MQKERLSSFSRGSGRRSQIEGIRKRKRPKSLRPCSSGGTKMAGKKRTYTFFISLLPRLVRTLVVFLGTESAFPLDHLPGFTSVYILELLGLENRRKSLLKPGFLSRARSSASQRPSSKPLISASFSLTAIEFRTKLTRSRPSQMSWCLSESANGEKRQKNSSKSGKVFLYLSLAQLAFHLRPSSTDARISLFFTTLNKLIPFAHE